MDADRFDFLARSLDAAISRRRALAALGSLVTLGALPASAKKGKKDKSTCVAHNVAGCTSERDVCVTNNAEASSCNPANPRALCLITTGNAPFCGSGSTVPPPACQPRRRDPDCLAFGYPAGSACIAQAGTFCTGACPDTGGTACVHPGA
jgi:hypothetical protein